MNEEKKKNGNRRVVGYDIMPSNARSRSQLSPASPVVAGLPSKHKTKTFEIKFSFPSPKIIAASTNSIKNKIAKIPRKILLICTALLVVVIIFITIHHQQVVNTLPRVANGPASVAKTTPALQRGTPDYKTILPTNKNIESLGGWTRVSPPDRNPVFAYIDKIGTTQINVSQQPLPDGFDVDSEAQVEQLAQGYKANEKVTAGSTTLHIGTSIKGPQSVILSKNNLLILIKSSVQISDDQWATYVNSLQ